LFVVFLFSFLFFDSLLLTRWIMHTF
jgi:hypothetical protein